MLIKGGSWAAWINNAVPCETAGYCKHKAMILKCPTCKTDCKFSEIRKEKLPEGGYLIRCGKCKCTIGIKDEKGRIEMLKPKEG